MTWSTRELAELADTTVNTVRHYHRVGLLEEPERRYNGYKQYDVQDLVRLLRIRRLADLGVPLAQIGGVGKDSGKGSGKRSGKRSGRSSGKTRTESSTGTSVDTLRALAAELEASMAQLQRAQADIAAILREDAPADAPAGFESVASRLSDSDNSILHIYRQIYDDDAMADVRRMLEVDAEAHEVGLEIEALAEDADEETRQRLAERLAPTLTQNLIDYPWLTDPVGHLSKSERVARQTIVEAIEELYHPAQRDVLTRAGAIALEQVEARRLTSRRSA